ncbi:MAG: cation:proton antiporter, partial [Ignavibacteriaceae bacterium]|nr:cation:proton antiporter [Ignavibacteriaceae bacterium]
MIAVLRRLIIISLLFGIFLFIQFVQVDAAAGINPKTLIAFGFAILASFTLGEILSIIKLPRVIGYLLIGMIFGPYSYIFLTTDILRVFNFSTLDNLSLVNGVTLSVIALTAGMELKIEGIKKSAKAISLIILLKVFIVFVLITTSVFAVSSFIPFLSGADWRIILAAGLILSVVSIGTSIELTLVVAEEAKAKGKFIDLILSTAIVKDVVVILLLAVVLTISTSLITPGAGFDINLIFDLGKELLFSIIFGAAWGGLIILYLKYINRELLIFIIAIIVFGTEITTILHLETLVAFITAGFVIQNFSKHADDVHHPLQKLALPIFITFFTVAGASLNFISVSNAILLGGIIFIVRAFAIWLSVSTASKISKETVDFKKFGWLGFLSIGGLILGLGIVIAERLPGLGDELKNVITALVALNIFLGPVLLKIGLAKSKTFEPIADDDKNKETISASIESIADSKKVKPKPKEELIFKEPQFNDERLNKSLYNILFRINKVLKDFEHRFIYYRGEQSVELIVHVTERYTEEYGRLRQIFLTPGTTAQEIKIKILEAKKVFAKGFIDLCEERKRIEKNILALEPLIDEIFYSLVDITDGLQNEYLIKMEPDWFEKNDDDSWRGKYWKYKLRAIEKIQKLFEKKYFSKRKISYRNLAKYYLVGESASEILETVNLVGSERLTTLRKTKSIYEDITKYLDELEQITINEKDTPAVAIILIDRLTEVHQQIVNELSIYSNEINRTTDEITGRLYYALASPFNRFIDAIKIAGTYKFDDRKFRYSKIFGKSESIKNKALDSIRFWVNYYDGFLGLFEKEVYINKLNSELNEVVNISLVNISAEINNNLRL